VKTRHRSREEKLAWRKGISIVVALTLLVIIAIGAGAFFHFWYTAFIKRGVEVAEVKIRVTNVGFSLGEDYSGIPGDPTELASKHGCMYHLPWKMCHVLDYGLDKTEGTSDDLLVARCFLSGCHYNEYHDPGGGYPNWYHRKDRLVIDLGGAHPVGGGVYAGHEDCLECHTGFTHNLYSTEDRRGACLKDDVAGCHDDPTEQTGPRLEPHRTVCVKPV